MPSIKEFKFSNHAKSLSPPFVIYADLESLLKRSDVVGVLQQHSPIAAAYNIVGNHTLKFPHYNQFIGIDCISTFFNDLERVANEIFNWNDINTRHVMSLPLSFQDEFNFNKATHCKL